MTLTLTDLELEESEDLVILALIEELDPVTLTEASLICSEGREIEELEDFVCDPLRLELLFVALVLTELELSEDLVTLTLTD